MTPDKVKAELQALTADLIAAGLCIDQNFPILERSGSVAEVHFGKVADLSVTLKNISYVHEIGRAHV